MSKIIKSSSREGIAITDFRYQPLSESAQLQTNPEKGSHDFIPLIIGQGKVFTNQHADDGPPGIPAVIAGVEDEELDDHEFIPLIFGQGEEANCHIAEDGYAALSAVNEMSVAIADEDLRERFRTVFDDGLHEGWRQAEDALNSRCQAIIEAVEWIIELREKVLRESEEDLLKLSMMVARKIIHQEISLDRQIIANVVAAAINSVTERDEIVIRLNPNDFQAVAEKRNFCLSGDEERHLVLKADKSVPIGGCMVDTTMGSIDAGIETRLEEICSCLLNGQGTACQFSADEGEE